MFSEPITLTEREIKFIEYLRMVKLPYGELLIRLIYQDGVIVRAVIEEKKESVKF